MKRRSIPVWIVTGYLGSGKTTLLKRWLREPGLVDAALVINEIGEVGFDDRMLANAVDSAMLLSNNCVCCTGLQGLEEALISLWWDRLHRRRPSFASVIIETTGLADPAPIVAALTENTFLRERYQLAGVLTTVSASGGAQILSEHAEAKAQVQRADVMVLTKVDREPATLLSQELQRLNPEAGLIHSAKASISWQDILMLLNRSFDLVTCPTLHGAHHARTHHHHAISSFQPMPGVLSRQQLTQELEKLIKRRELLRLKGIVALEGEGPCTVQWSIGDGHIEISGYLGEFAHLGVTFVRSYE